MKSLGQFCEPERYLLSRNYCSALFFFFSLFQLLIRQILFMMPHSNFCLSVLLVEKHKPVV